MTKIALLATVALMLATPAFAAPSPAAKCRFATPVEDVTYAQMPASIRNAIGPMAERDGAFTATDVIEPGEPAPARRVIRAGHRGNDWFVWYEAGGVAYSWHATAFRLEASGTPRMLANALIPVSWDKAANGWVARTDVCALIDGALAGRNPP